MILLTLLSIGITSSFIFLTTFNLMEIPSELFFGSRWISIVLIGYFVYRKKSLTGWILYSMILGAAIGYDFKDFALNLKVLSLVFLKLIKTIIGPLLFGTLVVGIAGHANLKQVGRMGFKSIIYFEIITTIALFIGLAAINITKAGEGINFPTVEVVENIKVEKQTASDIILHIFPENIAKSIADGQVLQIVIFTILRNAN